MIFIDNKYTNWYYAIIHNARNRTTSEYTERHHIVPKSLGGNDSANNLVKLTAREHFVCHLLLPKMTTGKAKRGMCYAAWQMTNIDNRPRYSPTARTYEMLRKQLSESYKGIPKTYKNWLGKKHTVESKKKQSEAKQGANNPMFGRLQSEDTKHLISLARKGAKDPLYVCIHCNRQIAGLGNYNRWHGDNCKLNMV